MFSPGRDRIGEVFEPAVFRVFNPPYGGLGLQVSRSNFGIKEILAGGFKLSFITLWLFKMAMGNGPFIDGLPMKNRDFPYIGNVIIPTVTHSYFSEGLWSTTNQNFWSWVKLSFIKRY